MFQRITLAAVLRADSRRQKPKKGEQALEVMRLRAEGGNSGGREEWSNFGHLLEGRACRLPCGLGWGVRKERHHGSL